MKQEPKERKAGKELQMSVKGSDEEAVSLPGGCSRRAPRFASARCWDAFGD